MYIYLDTNHLYYMWISCIDCIFYVFIALCRIDVCSICMLYVLTNKILCKLHMELARKPVRYLLKLLCVYTDIDLHVWTDGTTTLSQAKAGNICHCYQLGIDILKNVVQKNPRYWCPVCFENEHNFSLQDAALQGVRCPITCIFWVVGQYDND